MTFNGIYTEAANIRFNSASAELARVKNWVNAAELEVWNYADWVFKRVRAANLTVVAGVATMPADFGKALALYDPNGSELEWLPPDDFERWYSVGTPPVGSGQAYTVINRQILVGPADSATYKLAYRRRYTHFAAGSVATAGVMSLDTDFPLWDSEFHYVLVPLAIVCGARLENDPVPQNYQEQADRLLATMVDELREPGAEGAVQVWGEDWWR